MPKASRKDDLSAFCCLNPSCPEHGRRGAGNLTATEMYGPGRSKRRLRCRACRARFSERKGSSLFYSHLTADEVALVLGHVAGGKSIRETSRITGIGRGSIARAVRLNEG